MAAPPTIPPYTGAPPGLSMEKMAAPILLGILFNAAMFGAVSLSYIRYFTNFGIKKYKT
jgi:hypothetical protein